MIFKPDRERARSGEVLEREGLVQTPVGRAWKDKLDAISFGDSPISLFSEPMSRKLWRAFGEYVRKFRRRSKTPEITNRYAAIEELVSRLPGETVLLDLLNWMYELETYSGMKIYDGDTRGIARDRYDEFVTRVLVEGKGVGS